MNNRAKPSRVTRILVGLAMLLGASSGYACAYQYCYFLTCCVYNLKTEQEICGVTCMYCYCTQAP